VLSLLQMVDPYCLEASYKFMLSNDYTSTCFAAIAP
jgi:hypothetical protein